jgi:hypothetical protein
MGVNLGAKVPKAGAECLFSIVGSPRSALDQKCYVDMIDIECCRDGRGAQCQTRPADIRNTFRGLPGTGIIEEKHDRGFWVTFSPDNTTATAQAKYAAVDLYTRWDTVFRPWLHTLCFYLTLGHIDHPDLVLTLIDSVIATVLNLRPHPRQRPNGRLPLAVHEDPMQIRRSSYSKEWGTAAQRPTDYSTRQGRHLG